MTFEEYLASMGVNRNQLGPNQLDRYRDRYRTSGGTATATDPTNGYGINGTDWATLSANAAAQNAYTAGGGTGAEQSGLQSTQTPEQLQADVTQDWINENPVQVVQGQLGASGLQSVQGGTNFDNWLTNIYTPRVMQGYYQKMTADAMHPNDYTTGLINPAQARRMFLHRPDNERANQFSAGPGRYSWFG